MTTKICYECFKIDYNDGGSDLNSWLVDRYPDRKLKYVDACDHVFIDIDDQIAPFIRFFWMNGLRTKWSCAGHYYVFDNSVDFDGIIESRFEPLNEPSELTLRLPYVVFQFKTDEAAKEFLHTYGSKLPEVVVRPFLGFIPNSSKEVMWQYLGNRSALKHEERKLITDHFYDFLIRIAHDIKNKNNTESWLGK